MHHETEADAAALLQAARLIENLVPRIDEESRDEVIETVSRLRRLRRELLSDDQT